MTATIYTFGIGLDRTPEDLRALIPEHLRDPLHCAIADIRRNRRSRNHAWDAVPSVLDWACYRHVPTLANSWGAPVGARVPYMGQRLADAELSSIASLLQGEETLGEVCVVLVCQCRELEERYKRDGRLKSQCHRKPLAEELARRTGAKVVHLGTETRGAYPKEAGEV